MDLDAVGLLALSLEPIANNSNDDSQRADDDAKNVAVHDFESIDLHSTVNLVP